MIDLTEKSMKSYMEKARKMYDLKELERLGLSPDLDQRDMILMFMAMILKWNAAAGLISPKEEANIFIRHFCDSLQPLLLFGFKKHAKVLDVGAGGGFPSIPIRIFRPDLTFVLGESNRKKATFLKDVKAKLSLDNLEVFNGRIESLKTPQPAFDYAVSRGVGTLRAYAKIAAQHITSEGRMYTFKAKQFQVELEEITTNKDKEQIGIMEIAEYDLANQIMGLKLVSLAAIK